MVTNPPFSLIIGNVNAVKYKEIFPLFMKNELWLGASIHSGDMAFFVPDNYPLDAFASIVKRDAPALVPD